MTQPTAARRTRRLRVIATSLVAVLTIFVIAGSAAAYTYPSAYKKAFIGGCLKAAVKQKVPSHVAKVYCTGALDCLEVKLTTTQLQKASEQADRHIVNTNTRIIAACERSAAAKAKGQG